MPDDSRDVRRPGVPDDARELDPERDRYLRELADELRPRRRLFSWDDETVRAAAVVLVVAAMSVLVLLLFGPD